MSPPPPGSTRSDTLFPYTTLFRSPEVRYAFTGEAGYMFPRPDGIVIGGTYERNIWEAEPQPERIARIVAAHQRLFAGFRCPARSEEHTSELQSLMRISYAVFCLKKKTR